MSTSACAPLTPALDADFGESLRDSIDRQQINRFARYDTDPVSGLDGVAAVSATLRYERSFAAPSSPPNVFSTSGSSGTALTSIASPPQNQ